MTALLLLILLVLLGILMALWDITVLLTRVNKYIDFVDKAKKQSPGDTVMKVDGRIIRKSDVEKYI